MPFGRRAFALSLLDLWQFLAIALPILGSLLASISTVDLAYQIRAGEIIADTRTLPSPDTFTFTAAGRVWFDQQWAAQLVLASVYRIGGWALLAVVRAALVGLIAWLVLMACRSAGVGRRPSAWLTLAGFVVGLAALGMRPQLLGMVLFAMVLAILAARVRHPRLVWLTPVLIELWANVHGSFVFGPAAVGVAWLEDVAAGRPRPHRLLVVAIACGVATLANPYGPIVWGYAAGLTTDPRIRGLITEWQTTSPLSFVGFVFYGSVLLAAGLVAWLQRRGVVTIRRSWPTLVWLIGLGAVGAFAERGVAWWAIGAPVALARLIGPLLADRPVAVARRSLANTAVAGAVCLAIVAALPTWRGGDARYGPAGLVTDAPRGVTNAVLTAARPGDKVWNAQRWGSWLELAVPDVTVAVDSRVELIPADAWADHVELSGGAANWADILDRRGVTMVVANVDEQRGLIPLMAAASDWRLVYRDSEGAIFIRATR